MVKMRSARWIATSPPEPPALCAVQLTGTHWGAREGGRELDGRSSRAEEQGAGNEELPAPDWSTWVQRGTLGYHSGSPSFSRAPLLSPVVCVYRLSPQHLLSSAPSGHVACPAINVVACEEIAQGAWSPRSLARSGRCCGEGGGGCSKGKTVDSVLRVVLYC